MRIRRLNPELLPALREFFREIDRNEIKNFFQPHPFTNEEAEHLANYHGKDEYHVFEDGRRIVGYGILRGWDEGYERPSLGMCMLPSYSGKGLGKELTRHLLEVACARGAKEVILKVKKENERAIRLYEALGFQLSTLDGEYLRGVYQVPEPRSSGAEELTLLIATIDEAENLKTLVPELRAAFDPEQVKYEIFILDGGSKDGTPAVAERLGCRVEQQKERGYANAILQGIRNAKGRYLIVMDGDGSHRAQDALQLFHNRFRRDIIINSRYVSGGGSDAIWPRRVLSGILNLAYRLALGLPFREVSGGFRVYRREILNHIDSSSISYEIQEELLIVPYWLGYSALEIPYWYRDRNAGQSKARILNFGWKLLWALVRFRKLKKALQRRARKNREDLPMREEKISSANEAKGLI